MQSSKADSVQDHHARIVFESARLQDVARHVHWLPLNKVDADIRRTVEYCLRFSFQDRDQAFFPLPCGIHFAYQRKKNRAVELNDVFSSHLGMFDQGCKIRHSCIGAIAPAPDPGIEDNFETIAYDQPHTALIACFCGSVATVIFNTTACLRLVCNGIARHRQGQHHKEQPGP